MQAVDAVSGRLLVDHFHAVSDAVRVHAERQLRVPSERLTVVRRGRGDPRRQIAADAGRAVRDELGIQPDDLVVVHVGRQEHAKDHRTLLAAVDPLLGDRPAWLLAAGRPGNASDAVTVALSEAEHRDRIRFLGHRGDVAAVLAAADVLVLTSRYEGLPGAVIEAMAAAVPVVASDIGPVREVVVPGTTGLVCPPGDVLAFRDAISRLLDDGPLRRRMGERGRAEFEERFTIDRSAREMADLYRKLTFGRAT